MFFAFLRSHLGEPYDPISVLYFWGPFASFNWHDPGAWECAQFIGTALIAWKALEVLGTLSCLIFGSAYVAWLFRCKD